ncbi:MAG: trypsin-like peptidase domain-containing protein [Patescibacteria group bacterium]|nr:trypsin-like peptidase domain-containing protein [Patescibacteria group bacterium]
MIEYLQRPNFAPELPKPKNKKKKSLFRHTVLLIVIISFFVGSLSGAAVSLIISSLTKVNFQQPMTNNQSPNLSHQPSTDSQPKIKIIDEESATINVVKKAAPAVVSIVITQEVSRYITEWSPFEEFFKDWPFFEFRIPQPKQTPQKEKQQVGRGTGFIISSDGLILTNKHVVDDQEADYSVITNEGKTLPAKVLATDPFNDIAVMKVEAKNLPTLPLGDSDRLEIGQSVIAIGFALGEFRNTVTKGVISGIGRNITAGGAGRTEQLENVIQTDAAINPGNSGGPLLNLKGEVIGINTAMSLEGQLIGFAIPINEAKYVVESVKKFGRVVRPFLGIRYLLINETIAKTNKLPVDYGALIVRGETATDFAVTPGSAADKAGLMENDIILELNGQKITPDNPLAKMIQKFKPGDEVTLKVLSRGKEKIIKVVLGEYKE